MHGPVPLDPRHRRKGRRRDRHLPVRCARAVVTGMAGVAVAFVLDHEVIGRERSLEPGPDFVLNFHLSAAPPSHCRACV